MAFAPDPFSSPVIVIETNAVTSTAYTFQLSPEEQTVATAEGSQQRATGDPCTRAMGLLPGMNAPRALGTYNPPLRPLTGPPTVTVTARWWRMHRQFPNPPGQGTFANPKVRVWAQRLGYNAFEGGPDHAGHVIGKQFGGSIEHGTLNGNIFPQHGPTNSYGSYHQVETFARGLYDSNHDVCAHIGLNYNFADPRFPLRPTSGTYTLLYARQRTWRMVVVPFDNPTY